MIYNIWKIKLNIFFFFFFLHDRNVFWRIRKELEFIVIDSVYYNDYLIFVKPRIIDRRYIIFANRIGKDYKLMLIR